MTHQCRCCGGTGRLDPAERPLCPCVIQARDTRSPDQLRRFAGLQRVALRGIVFDRDGRLVDEHGEAYVDHRDGQVCA